MLIASPTGSGKTSAVIKMIKHTSMPVIYVTNRKMALCQFKKDDIKASKGLDVPAELLDSISLGENIIAITYQELAETTYKYRFFCKCWGRRKQRSFGKNQMRTAF